MQLKRLAQTAAMLAIVLFAAGASSPLCTTPGSAVRACEDTHDNATTVDATGGFVGLSGGGHEYDVALLGMARGTGVNAPALFVGLASGVRPDNGSTLYRPGDLFLTVNGIAYVIDMGGDAGPTGGAAVGAQTQSAAGSYSTLDGSGDTPSVTSLPGQIGGSIWTVAGGTTTQTAWATVPTQWQQGAGAVSLGTATCDPACVNNVLAGTGTTPVPEPAALFLGGVGLIALGYAARGRLFGRQP